MRASTMGAKVEKHMAFTTPGRAISQTYTKGGTTIPMRKALFVLTWGRMAVAALAMAACGSTASPAPGVSASPTTSQPTQATKSTGTLTVYAGREEKLVGPLVERFNKETGVDIKVRYGDTAELAAAILNERKNSPPH